VRCVGGVLASPLYFCMCIRFTLRGRDRRRKREREGGSEKREGRKGGSGERRRRERESEQEEGGRDNERRTEGVTSIQYHNGFLANTMI